MKRKEISFSLEEVISTENACKKFDVKYFIEHFYRKLRYISIFLTLQNLPFKKSLSTIKTYTFY